MGKKWPKMKRSENKISQLMTKISGFTATAEAATTTTAPNDIILLNIMLFIYWVPKSLV